MGGWGLNAALWMPDAMHACMLHVFTCIQVSVLANGHGHQDIVLQVCLRRRRQVDVLFAVQGFVQVVLLLQLQACWDFWESRVAACTHACMHASTAHNDNDGYGSGSPPYWEARGTVSGQDLTCVSKHPPACL